MLRRILGSKRKEMVGGWRKLDNEEIHNLYALPNIRIIMSRRTRWAKHVAPIGDIRNSYKIFVGKPKGKRILRGPGHRWEDLREIGWEGLDWMHLAQDREQGHALVNMIMNLWVP
jgi:hypothetical protein